MSGPPRSAGVTRTQGTCIFSLTLAQVHPEHLVTDVWAEGDSLGEDGTFKVAFVTPELLAHSVASGD